MDTPLDDEFQLIRLQQRQDFYNLLGQVFSAYQEAGGAPVPASYEKFMYKGIIVYVPADIYFDLCALRFSTTNSDDERHYFANCGMRIYNKRRNRAADVWKEEKGRAAVFESFKPFYVRHYRAAYSTIYGDEISEEMRSNISDKLKSLPQDVILRRNTAIKKALEEKKDRQSQED